MKICILTPRFPFPKNGGDVLRINNIARYLKSKGHTLILVSYSGGGECDAERIYDKIYPIRRSGLAALGYSMWAFLLGKPIQIGYYFSLAFLSVFKKIVRDEKPDLYIAHLVRMVPYLNICHLQDKAIVEMTDALSKTYTLSNAVTRFSFKKLVCHREKARSQI